MRINELTGYKNDPLYNILQNTSNASELEKNLESGGFKKYLIGSGLFSSVLTRPDLNYVVKIFHNDPGYETYLTYIMKYQNNPHVPKMRGKVISVGPNFKVVRLEKLNPIDKFDNLQMRLFDLMRQYLYNNKHNKYMVKLNIPDALPVLDDIMSQSNNIDFHDGNVMFRGSVPVITDPLAII
jgi:hypothetical protein